ncbi:MAG: hypothetical protein JWP65_2011 [Ramlibacter sp.]|jgi:hypothetical protein|uniref:hypothetical protein n=1 Tax=Ramlibacter sp. TaxID=1917967 RepID=UPI00262101FE|nr:hypothetical protein [Ramlibacter sp.]MDB5751590.1 hypothetical protein [Ramlibacter sp.]
MNRWFASALLGLSFASCAAVAQGIVREAPKDVKPAMMAVSATPPIIAVNGEPARLSPGARIRDTNNMLVLSGALAGKTVYTVYRRDPVGNVHEVWLLTQQEYAKVGGSAGGDPEGHKRFYELLNLVFAARAAMMLR